jgi:hypothetical protein
MMNFAPVIQRWKPVKEFLYDSFEKESGVRGVQGKYHNANR